MNKMMIAIAFAVALPGIANAQASQAPAKAGCCADMKEMCACCKDMAGMSGAGHGKNAGGAHPHMGDGPAGHDMSQQGRSAPAADSH